MAWTTTSEEINALKKQIKDLEGEIRSKDYPMQQLAKRNKELEKQTADLKKDNELLDQMYERERRKRRAKNA